tara:strand:+ start:2256 stop:2612 length:357 start_codon:yes stop_codon:yes gene_type:complete
MSTNSNNISLFNTKVLEYLSFINDLLIDKKTKKKLFTYTNKIKIGLLMDNLILMNLFKKYIYIYKNDINDKNKVILNKMEEHLFENKIKITDIWDTIEEKNKETIWKYLKVFILLCEQ